MPHSDEGVAEALQERDRLRDTLVLVREVLLDNEDIQAVLELIDEALS